jgi:hypothetical protein
MGMKILHGSLIRRGALALALAAAAGLAGCASGFRIDRVAETTYPVTTRVELIRGEPTQPYEVLAAFRGAEMDLCSSEQPYCSLVKRAQELGANAIWIQHVDHWTRPEQWVMIDGKMTRIDQAIYETLEGVLIRYRD